ncbi:MAG: FkbM family methyltransferase [Nitrospirales bacterium]
MGISMDSLYEPTCTGEYAFLRRLSESWGAHPLVMDVGAGVGLYAKLVRHLAPEATVYAFEPHPKAFALLEEEARRSGFTALNQGCGDTQGKMPLYDYASDEGSPVASVYQEVIEGLWRARSTSTVVPIITLDRFLHDHGIDRVTLLKVDTEGHELRVLQGARSSITNHLIDVIQFEFNVMNIFSRTYMKDFYDLLPNYDFYRILPGGVVPLGPYRATLHEIFAFQNIVAVRDGCASVFQN